MNIIAFLLPLALMLGLVFLIAFIVSAWNGQYDDLETPARRMLLEDSDSPAPENERKQQ